MYYLYRVVFFSIGCGILSATSLAMNNCQIPGVPDEQVRKWIQEPYSDKCYERSGEEKRLHEQWGKDRAETLKAIHELLKGQARTELEKKRRSREIIHACSEYISYFDPVKADLLFHRGQNLLELGYLKEALEDFTSAALFALFQGYSRSDALYGAAKACELLGRLQEALYYGDLAFQELQKECSMGGKLRPMKIIG